MTQLSGANAFGAKPARWKQQGFQDGLTGARAEAAQPAYVFLMEREW
ncbi:hypothetical protein [Rhizobium sp. R635]|nr:hypothetical protein [Rhizobium sp. R635]